MSKTPGDKKPLPHRAGNATAQAHARWRRARVFVMQGVYEWQMTGNPAHEIAARAHASNDLHKIDPQYYLEALTAITQQTERWDEALSAVLNVEVQDIGGVERAILRLGAYELLARLERPARVVISEAVKLAVDFGATDSHQMINAVLHRLAVSARPAEMDERA